VSGSQSPARYEIRAEGVLDKRWTAWFEGLQVTREGSQTVISGPLPDQPALHGVLIKVRDLGMCLISVRRLDQDRTGQASRLEIPPRHGHQPPARRDRKGGRR
jgi:hypothetical protein